jgi:hypothetical protein
VELLVERLASQYAVAINMNEWQKLGSRQGVSNDRIWVEGSLLTPQGGRVVMDILPP